MSTLPTVAVERQAGDTASTPRQVLAGCLKIGDGAVEADRHPMSVHVTDRAVVPVEFFDKMAMNYGVAGRSHCKSPDKSSTTVSTLLRQHDMCQLAIEATLCPGADQRLCGSSLVQAAAAGSVGFRVRRSTSHCSCCFKKGGSPLP